MVNISKISPAFSNLPVISLVALLMLLLFGFQYVTIKAYSQLPFVPSPSSPSSLPPDSSNSTAPTTASRNSQSSINSSAPKQQQSSRQEEQQPK